MADRPPIRKVPSYRPPGLLRRPTARPTLHGAVSDTCPKDEPQTTQSTNVARGPCEARGEAEAPEGPITQAGPRKARGGAARDVLGPDWAVAFGQRFKQALKARGLTQVQAAAELGVARSAVVQWCKGGCLPTVARLFHAVRLLRLDPRLIFPEWFV